MVNAISGRDTSAQSTPAASPVASNGNDALANEGTFLKLLVSQLKNQDPESPQDPTQFVAQLAQFSGLEQQLQMRQDLDAIKQSLQTAAAAAPATPATGVAQP